MGPKFLGGGYPKNLFTVFYCRPIHAMC